MRREFNNLAHLSGIVKPNLSTQTRFGQISVKDLPVEANGPYLAIFGVGQARPVSWSASGHEIKVCMAGDWMNNELVRSLCCRPA